MRRGILEGADAEQQQQQAAAISQHKAQGGFAMVSNLSLAALVVLIIKSE